ncbi:MAG: ATP-binding protein, partial [Pseudorhodoplanes sp.]
FEIAMVNLVLNARDAMLDGGHVVIHAENVRTHVDVNGPDARYVAIHVRDSGVGIPDDVMPKIFDPFFTTKAVGKGTGLGLSQVHGFAHQAGGTVRVASRLGHGTTFTLYLPHASMPQTAAEVLAAEPKSGVALLVEDNPDVASASTVLLEQLGYRVRWASSAEAALEQVRRNGIDIVLSDIVMPGRMDGLELARTLKQDHPRLPVLLMTGYSDRAQNDQNFIILRKPYEVQELSRAIAQVVAHCPTAA